MPVTVLMKRLEQYYRRVMGAAVLCPLSAHLHREAEEEEEEAEEEEEQNPHYRLCAIDLRSRNSISAAMDLFLLSLLPTLPRRRYSDLGKAEQGG